MRKVIEVGTMRGACFAAALLVSACVTGGDGGSSVSVAMPGDTYDTCAGGGSAALSEGVNFLSSGSGSSTVRLGMSECQLVSALGAPTAVSPALAPEGQRHVTMVYANPDGNSTAYVFVNNALKEMNRVNNNPAPLDAPAGTPTGAAPG